MITGFQHSSWWYVQQQLAFTQAKKQVVEERVQ